MLVVKVFIIFGSLAQTRACAASGFQLGLGGRELKAFESNIASKMSPMKSPMMSPGIVARALCVSDLYVLGSGGLLADNAIIFEGGCVLGSIGCFIITLQIFLKG